MFSVSDKVKFIESAFGAVRLSAKSANAVVCCPACAPADRSKRKLSIRLNDDVNHCWVCGWSAKSLLPLLIKFSDNTHIDTYKKVFYVNKNKGNLEEETIVKKLELPKNFKLLATIQKTSDPDICAAKNYLKNRGLDERDFWYFGFGVSDDFEFRKRIIFPSFDSAGELNFFTSRTFDPENRIKYVNCDVKKKDIIFNEIKIDWTQPLTIVEGPFDITKCNDNATCLLGSELSEDSALLNAILYHSPIINLCLDSDMKQKSQKIAKKLVEYNIDARIVDLGQFHDPGEMSKENFLNFLNAAQQWKWDSYMKSRLTSISSRLTI